MGVIKMNRVHQHTIVAGLAVLAVMLLSAAGVAASERLSSTGASGSGRGPTKYYYYPDYAKPHYAYQSGAPYTRQMLVIPPTVPIVTQPEMYIVDAPPAVAAPTRVVDPNWRQQAEARGWGGEPQVLDPLTVRYRQRLQSHARYQGLSRGLSSAPPPVPMAPPAPLPERQTRVQPPAPVQQAAPWQQPRQTVSVPATMSYSLHVGSYLVYEDADEDERRVRNLGVPTYRKRASVNGIHYVQLHAGPFSDRLSAESAAANLKDALKTPALIQPYRL